MVLALLVYIILVGVTMYRAALSKSDPSIVLLVVTLLFTPFVIFRIRDIGYPVFALPIFFFPLASPALLVLPTDYAQTHKADPLVRVYVGVLVGLVGILFGAVVIAVIVKSG